MTTEFGWHYQHANKCWFLGNLSVGEGEVRDPKAEIENQNGVWYWRVYGSRYWGTSGTFNEAMVQVHQVMVG